MTYCSLAQHHNTYRPIPPPDMPPSKLGNLRAKSLSRPRFNKPETHRNTSSAPSHHHERGQTWLYVFESHLLVGHFDLIAAKAMLLLSQSYKSCNQKGEARHGFVFASWCYLQVTVSHRLSLESVLLIALWFRKPSQTSIPARRLEGDEMLEQGL